MFSREAQWGSRGREFDSRHSDHLLLSRTVFGLARLGSFFHFSTIFFGDVEIDGQFRVAHLDLAHEGVDETATVCLGLLGGGNEELFQQVRTSSLEKTGNFGSDSSDDS